MTYSPADRDRPNRDATSVAWSSTSSSSVWRRGRRPKGKIAELNVDGSLDPNNFTWPYGSDKIVQVRGLLVMIRCRRSDSTRSWCRHCCRQGSSGSSAGSDPGQAINLTRRSSRTDGRGREPRSDLGRAGPTWLLKLDCRGRHRRRPGARQASVQTAQTEWDASCRRDRPEPDSVRLPTCSARVPTDGVLRRTRILAIQRPGVGIGSRPLAAHLREGWRECAVRLGNPPSSPVGVIYGASTARRPPGNGHGDHMRRPRVDVTYLNGLG